MPSLDAVGLMVSDKLIFEFQGEKEMKNGKFWRFKGHNSYKKWSYSVDLITWNVDLDVPNHMQFEFLKYLV